MAEIDGAGRWARFWNVTLPMLTATIFLNLILGIIAAMQVFDIPYVMTRGGPIPARMADQRQFHRLAAAGVGASAGGTRRPIPAHLSAGGRAGPPRRAKIARREPGRTAIMNDAEQSGRGTDREQPMTIKERNQDIRMVAELVQVHLPNSLKDSDLCKDVCAVVAVNLRRYAADVEKSAGAWDKRAYHSKADELRRESAWALPAAQVAEQLAYTSRSFTADDWRRLQSMLPPDLELPVRPRFKDVRVLRGAAAAARQTVLKRK